MAGDQFPGLPALGALLADDGFWCYPPGSGVVGGAARLRVWAATGGGHLAVVTELGIGASVTNSAEGIWGKLTACWPGDLVLMEHWPASETLSGDDEHLDQVVIGDDPRPRWRRIWPVPPSHADHDLLARWMDAHGRQIMEAGRGPGAAGETQRQP